LNKIIEAAIKKTNLTKEYFSYELQDILINQSILHQFAKAFWGEDEIETGEGIEIKDNPEDKIHIKIGKKTKPAWQHHLRQMVLEKEPLKYLEKFL